MTEEQKKKKSDKIARRILKFQMLKKLEWEEKKKERKTL
jgi:hypothetical protein